MADEQLVEEVEEQAATEQESGRPEPSQPDEELSARHARTCVEHGLRERRGGDYEQEDDALYPDAHRQRDCRGSAELAEKGRALQHAGHGVCREDEGGEKGGLGHQDSREEEGRQEERQ